MELTGNIRTVYQTIAIIAAILSLVGFAIFWVAIWNRRKLQAKSIWVMSLSFSDSIMAVNLILASFVIFEKERNIGEFGSQIYACLSLAGGFVSIGNIAGIAMDKYYQACRPEKFGVNYGFYLGAMWGFGFLVAGMPAFGLGSYEKMTENSVSCVVDLESDENRVFVMSVALLWFVIPVLLMMTYYKKLVNESKKFKTLATAVLAIFLSCYTPYALYAGLKVTIGLGSVPMSLKALIYIFPKLLIAIDPYLYMISDPDLLKACKNIIFEENEKKKN